MCTSTGKAVSRSGPLLGSRGRDMETALRVEVCQRVTQCTAASNMCAKAVQQKQRVSVNRDHGSLFTQAMLACAAVAPLTVTSYHTFLQVTSSKLFVAPSCCTSACYSNGPTAEQKQSKCKTNHTCENTCRQLTLFPRKTVVKAS